MSKTVKRLTDLMAGIHKKYYDEVKQPDEIYGDIGGLWIHEGNPDKPSVSIDLYHFEGDGLPVCEGLDFDGYHPTTHQLIHQRVFCICYCPEWEQPLYILCCEDDGDSDDWEMPPTDIPVAVLTRIADWIESEMNKQ